MWEERRWGDVGREKRQVADHLLVLELSRNVI